MPKKKVYTATMKLPPGGKRAWTELMQGTVKVSEDIFENQPIVLATARFKNGILVTGGVYKSGTPNEYNIKIFHTFDALGNLIVSPYIPIDVSDHEDFLAKSILFVINEDETEEYLLKIVEG
ncbi:MAG: hypothetical protein NW226_04750 [Microscillaceae bacterium]|nr:hypothetical protein [Microscillaceae bacterium]